MTTHDEVMEAAERLLSRAKVLKSLDAIAGSLNTQDTIEVCTRLLELEKLAQINWDKWNYKELESQLQASKEENERLKEALEFYAEKSNWVSRSGKIGICPIDTTDRENFGPEYPWAGGKKAREALKGGI